MALAISQTRISRENYLRGELISGSKHEYIAGEVYAMSGGTLIHQRLATNFLRIAGNQLVGRSCFPTNSDFKIRIDLGGGNEAFYYPDGAIICVPVPDEALFTESPSVILEVISPATRRIDEVQKLRDYISIATLQSYVLVETDAMKITVYRRDGGDFRQEKLSGADAILELPEVGVSMALGDLHSPGA